MKTSRSIFLTGLSILLFLMSACHMSQYRKGGIVDISGPGYQELRAFGPGFTKALYHAELSVKEYRFNGLMMIKAFPDNSYKLAFFSELGLNFFDFQLRPANKKNKLNLYVNNIYSPLDRPVLLNSLEKYFSMLFSPGLEEGRYKTYLKKDGSEVMVRVDSYKGRDAYLSKNLIEPYTAIVNLSGLTASEKVSIHIVPSLDGSGPLAVEIRHAGAGLQMELKRIE